MSRSERGSGGVTLIGAVVTCYIILVILNLLGIRWEQPLVEAVAWGADKTRELGHFVGKWVATW